MKEQNKTSYYPDISSNPNLPEIESKIQKIWEQEDIFKESVEKNKEPEWIFYDGPPFANGLPHYGHLLTSFVKDIFARYQTMKCKKVERRFGWDCHGLPAEMEAEKELGVSGRKAIEDFGIERFNQHCRESVMKYTNIWQDYITRAGRWVDFKNDYKTMDLSYMESVLWAFKRLYEKGLIYESHRVMPYSWAAQTPLSNFETRMDDAYRERKGKAITVAFEFKEPPQSIKDEIKEIKGSLSSTEKELNPHFNPQRFYICAWTTTPWTLPSNLALAVSKEFEYRAFYDKENKGLYFASSKWVRENNKESEFLIYDTNISDSPYNISIDIYGNELLKLSYVPLFPYFSSTENAFRILDGSDFITEEDGTGIVHLAPGFGEDDQRVCEKAGIKIICPVDEAGKYTDEIFDLDAPALSLKNLNVIAATQKSADEPYTEDHLQKYGLANLRIIQYLKETEKLIKQEDYEHPYPFCWRTDTPLIYKAVPSWYVEVTKIRDRMVELNQGINWIPSHIRDGQFGKWLENARDWSISRNRFWGCPIPVWKSNNPNNKKLYVFGSIKEIEDFFAPYHKGLKINDLHRPFIDLLTAPDPEDSKYTISRVTDVFDCWFESGSMPFAQVHYPFDNKEWFETHFPADFIVEYVGQTRGWFYTLMVLSTAIFDRIPFKNCICHGVILDEKGKKLSKKLRNYPDPNDIFNQYGADAMRWRMISEPIMHGGNLLISKDGNDIRDIVRLVIKPIWNAYNFFTLYANADKIKAEKINIADIKNLMDRYIMAKLKYSVRTIEKSLDNFDTPSACKVIIDFFEVLNNWYIRRNRERFWRSASIDKKDEDKQAAYNTLYSVLITMCQAAAPLLPMTMEEIYGGLININH